MSVSQFAQVNDVFFKFNPNTYYAKSQLPEKKLLQGPIKNDLYSSRPAQSLTPTDFPPTAVKEFPTLSFGI